MPSRQSSSAQYRTDYKRLRAMIQLRGYSTAAFAKLIGVSDSGLSCVLDGRPPSCEMMKRIAEGLRLTPAEATEIFFARHLLIM